jgi:oligoendopeptidase F
MLKIKQTSWNLKPLFKNDTDPAMKKKRTEHERATLKFVRKWKNRADYIKDPKILKRALDEFEKWQNNFGIYGDLVYYWWLRSEQEQNNARIKAELKKAENHSQKMNNAIQFFELKIAKIEKKMQSKFLNYKPLKPYQHFLENLFINAQYNLSEPEEKILTLKSGPAYSNWTRMTEQFLAKEVQKVLIKSGKYSAKPFSELGIVPGLP